MIRVIPQDGGLGIQRPNTARLQAKIGVSSAGTANEIVRVRSMADAVTAFGTGPLVNALVDSFAAGAQDVLAVRAAGDVAGTISAITATKTGSGTLATAGAPLDAYDVEVEILTTGTLNGATFRYSLDGADTWSGRITVPVDGSYILPGTGITIQFAAGVPVEDSFKIGDVFTFTTTAPTASVDSLTAALNGLLTTALEFELIHVVGPTTAAVWAVLGTRAAEAEGTGRYFHVVAETRGPSGAETPATWAAAVVAEAAAVADVRLTLVAGRAEIMDASTGRIMERNIAGIYTGRLAGIAEQRSPAEVALGQLPQINRLAPAGITADDLVVLDDGRMVCARSILGLSGYYINEGHVLGGDGSDYQTVETRRIMDRACRLVRRASLRFDHAEGTPEGVAALEANLSAPLENEMSGQIQSGRVIIPEQDLLTTQQLTAYVRIVPIPIMREIEVMVGFETGGVTNVG